jgi:dTDP-glucose 4,6-dehydratase
LRFQPLQVTGPSLCTTANDDGPYEFSEKFLPLMITSALDDKALPIYGDGKQQRDWLHVEDKYEAGG